MATENITSRLIEPTQFLREPVKNGLEANFNALNRVTRALAKKTHVDLRMVTASGKTKGLKVERKTNDRVFRRDLYQQFKETANRDERREILDQARQYDRLSEELLKQGQVAVDIPGLGEQSVNYAILNEQTPEQRKQKPPIVLLPGILNDITCIEILGKYLGMRGEEVVILPQPGTYMSQVTPEFVKAVEASDNFKVFTDYQKAAIDAVIGHDVDFRLMGHSMGSAIAFELLSDSKYQERVKDAVLFSPAGVTDMTPTDMKVGIAKEFAVLAQDLENVERYGFTGGKDADSNYIGSEQEKYRWQIFKAAEAACRKDQGSWRNARVKDGGKIVVVATGQDGLTNCYKVFNPGNYKEVKAANPQIALLTNKAGNHAWPVVYPEKDVPLAFNMLKS